MLKGEDNVFKLVGPVLLKQDLIEAQQTVSKRIEYIEEETWDILSKTNRFQKAIKNFTYLIFRKRHDKAITDIEAKQDGMKEGLNKIQQQLQQQKVKMAMKA